jgi:PII-like signaling protein
MGFGKTSRLHTAKVLNLSTDLPIVIEMVDSEANIQRFLPYLETMLKGGLATLEKVKVLHYRGEPPGA